MLRNLFGGIIVRWMQAFSTPNNFVIVNNKRQEYMLVTHIFGTLLYNLCFTCSVQIQSMLCDVMATSKVTHLMRKRLTLNFVEVMVALDRIDPPQQPTKNANQLGIDSSGGKPEISSLGSSEQNMDIANEETL